MLPVSVVIKEEGGLWSVGVVIGVGSECGQFGGQWVWPVGVGSGSGW